jgi:signal transduction histidine kinase
MSAGSGFGAASLRQEDFLRFNRWLWVTRLQSIATILLVVGIIKCLAPTALHVGPVVLVCLATLIPSWLYHRWLHTRRGLRALAYTQLLVDTLAIVGGLFFIYDSPVLFHFTLLLVVVPASMIEWQCGLFIAFAASLGHFLLLHINGSAAPLSVPGLALPASFFLVSMQSQFYARHLADKNIELASAAASLNESNLRLEEEAAISGALLRTARVLTTSLDPQAILARLNDVVRETLGCDFSATLLYDAERKVYRVAAASGLHAEILEEVHTVEFLAESTRLFAAAAQQGVLAVEAPSAGLFLRPLLERWRVSSFLCADLRRAGSSVGLLAAGFNHRQGPFSAREDRLFRSIAQQAAMALENARLVDSLRSASRLKSEFIGTMSHELRSPLNVVIGYVDLLTEGEMGPLAPLQQDTLQRVRRQALQLLELIQETLDVNRLEAGLMPLDVETFKVREFLDDLRLSIPTDWLKPGVELTWQIDSQPLVLRSDRTKLKKVVRNLIHNALKFTDGGAVAVGAAAENGWIDFTVSDTGIGISQEALPVIFEMFRQVDGSNTRRHGGVGLGLYIVKQLVRALGGDITVASTIGSGSTFRVRLRRAEEQTEPDRLTA